jgi:hypothetical protein
MSWDRSNIERPRTNRPPADRSDRLRVIGGSAADAAQPIEGRRLQGRADEGQDAAADDRAIRCGSFEGRQAADDQLTSGFHRLADGSEPDWPLLHFRFVPPNRKSPHLPRVSCDALAVLQRCRHRGRMVSQRLQRDGRYVCISYCRFCAWISGRLVPCAA